MPENLVVESNASVTVKQFHFVCGYLCFFSLSLSISRFYYFVFLLNSKSASHSATGTINRLKYFAFNDDYATKKHNKKDWFGVYQDILSLLQSTSVHSKTQPMRKWFRSWDESNAMVFNFISVSFIAYI